MINTIAIGDKFNIEFEIIETDISTGIPGAETFKVKFNNNWEVEVPPGFVERLNEKAK